MPRLGNERQHRRHQAERSGQRHAEDRQARADENAHRRHRRELAHQPPPKREAQLIEHLAEPPAPRRGEEREEAAAVKLRLESEENADDQREEQSAQAVHRQPGKLHRALPVVVARGLHRALGRVVQMLAPVRRLHLLHQLVISLRQFVGKMSRLLGNCRPDDQSRQHEELQDTNQHEGHARRVTEARIALEKAAQPGKEDREKHRRKKEQQHLRCVPDQNRAGQDSRDAQSHFHRLAHGGIDPQPALRVIGRRGRRCHGET